MAILSRMTIRARLILLSGLLLAGLIWTNAFLIHRLEQNAGSLTAQVTLREVLKTAHAAQRSFDDLKYWLTDYAVSLLIISERNAEAAKTDFSDHLRSLSARDPETVRAAEESLDELMAVTKRAIDAYADDRRVIGNTLMAHARMHMSAIDERLEGLMEDLSAEADETGARAREEAHQAVEISIVVVVVAVAVGIVLTFVVFRSIADPLRRLVAAIDGIRSGDLGTEIPRFGGDELGSMSRALGELKQAQTSLVHAEKLALLGQLTAGIAHEIKNPLNFVNNFSALSVELLDDLKATLGKSIADLDDDARADAEDLLATLTGNMRKIGEHGRRADGIVKSMLAHSREGPGERRPAELNALVEESLNLAYHGARATDPTFNVTLDRDFDPDAGTVRIVPPDISRVLLNLFTNGFHATQERLRREGDTGYRPTVHVSTRRIDGFVEIRVRDNGTGIPPAAVSKIFTPFFTTKPAGEGTGLGLSLSYDIVVHQHGGRLDVDTRQNDYTEFVVQLPDAEEASAGSGTAPWAGDGAADVQRRRVAGG